ncbi:ribonuclease Z [Candidatus Woesearchaeota archaeon]|nr:MAG: ribonuclease Z [Candidatus Woesearchaeota archaeon]
MIEVCFLGTSSMVPTKERNVQGIFLSYQNEGILIDCGEGTQRQMNILGINRNRITRILISHWHGDHVSGLIGLIQTLGNNPEQKTLYLYGPKGTKTKMKHLLQSCSFENKVDLQIKELPYQKLKTFFETENFALQCAPLKHSIPCLGYSFIEKDRRTMLPQKLKALGVTGHLIGQLQKGKSVAVKGKTVTPDDVSTMTKGKKIAFVFDTLLCNNCYELAKDADVFISESTYSSSLEEKATQYKHMTSQQAGIIANKANVKKLILTHLSQRYKTNEEVLEDARAVFPNVEVAFDFMKIKL